MKTQLSHVVGMVFDRPWFIREETLREMASLVQLHVSGGRLSPEEISERLDVAAAANGPRQVRTTGNVGVIPIYGFIAPRSTLMSSFSGGTSVEAIRSAFRSAMADDQVGSILFDIDSPGGYTDGIEELATEIRQARGTKPIVAIADYGMASAAYYLGAQADEVVATPSAQVGWIGTVLVHQEFSKMDAEAGITTTIFRDPAGKFGGNEYEPLSEKARTDLKAFVDDLSAQFHAAVAKGRGVSVATVKADFGQGGGMMAARAKAAGLVDRVDTFDATVQRMAAGKVTMRPVGARATAGQFSDRPLLLESSMTWQDIEASDDAANQGGDGAPTDDPEADAAGEVGTPPETLDEIALEQAIASRRRRPVNRHPLR